MRMTANWAAACLSIALLAACDSSEERAEEHYQRGVELLQAGDVDRALVEFRNVFELDGFHRDARRLYAEAEIERGNLREGYGHYLRLVEQYPEDLDARRELAALALDRADWEQVERHGMVVYAEQPDDQVGRLSDLALRYRAAVEAEDEAARTEVVEEALAMREQMPDQPLLYELVADHNVRLGNRERALDAIAQAIELDPQDRKLYTMRLVLLQEMGDLDAVEAQLREMVEIFPDDPSAPATLIRWYMSQGNLDAAEAYLRERAADGTDEAMKVALIEFLARFREPSAAIEELDALIATGGGDQQLFRSLRAGLIFQQGAQEEAIAEMQAILDAAEEETDQTRNVKVALARMLLQTGNQVGARAQVEDVLEADATNVEALKMQAGWLIAADEPERAIATLRNALQQSPRDPQIMTLMANAHERAGNRELTGEMLSLAVEASNAAPPESLRYARYLAADDNLDIAEEVIIDSLRLNADNPQLLQLLGSIYVQQSDWARAEQVVESLESVEDPEATAMANSLRARLISAQGQTQDVVSFLQQLVDQGQAGLGAEVAIVRTHIQDGDIGAARSYVDQRLAEDPENPAMRFMQGSILELSGNTAEAEEIYRSIIGENEAADFAWRALYLLQMRDGRPEEASETLERAIAANPASLDLLWARASRLQQEGDLEAALAVYETMYEQNNSAPVIANNLASLLTMLRQDEESIARAYAVARRLRDVDVPAFQDTFGWIAFLRGEYEEAVEHLEPAAAALDQDPSVQYHLAMAYVALDRRQDAIAAFERAIDLAGEDSNVPEVARAREQLAELRGENVEN